MSLCCTVCAEWYPGAGIDRLDICNECYTRNFAGAQAPLDPVVTARAALEAYVHATRPLTPRQVAAMTRIHQCWEAEARRRLEEA